MFTSPTWHAINIFFKTLSSFQGRGNTQFPGSHPVSLNRFTFGVLIIIFPFFKWIRLVKAIIACGCPTFFVELWRRMYNCYSFFLNGFKLHISGYRNFNLEGRNLSSVQFYLSIFFTLAIVTAKDTFLIHGDDLTKTSKLCPLLMLLLKAIDHACILFRSMNHWCK